MKGRERSRKGQATVEYLLVVSFLAVAMGLATAVVYRAMHAQTGRLVEDLGDHLEDGRAQ